MTDEAIIGTDSFRLNERKSTIMFLPIFSIENEPHDVAK